MKTQNIFLTSVTALTLVVPALADPVTPNIAVGTNPADCTEPVLGTTTGTSNLQASWTPNTLNIDWYNGETKLTSNTCTYDSGITVPATNPTKTGYTFAGWRVKQIANILATLNIATDGDHYYGHGWNNNADYCNSDTDNGNAYCSSQDMSGIALNEWKTEFSYGTVYGEASCQSTLDSGMAYVARNLDAVLEEQMDPMVFLSNYASIAGQEKGAILADIFTRFSNGEVSQDRAYSELYGKILSSTDNTQYNKNTTGQHCFCKATGYTPLNGNKQNVASSSWVFIDGYASADNCADFCARDCAFSVQGNGSFRGAVFGAFGD